MIFKFIITKKKEMEHSSTDDEELREYLLFHVICINNDKFGISFNVAVCNMLYLTLQLIIEVLYLF